MALAACGSERSPNIVLVSIDTLRQDHVSAYGYSRPTTPTIDRLAAEGALFENAYSTSSWTLPAHMSAFTGLLPSSHQVEDDNDRLGESTLTLTQFLRRRGYATAGVASHVYLAGGYGFDRGFDTYEVGVDQTADAVTDRALAWLAERRDLPFLLFVHYFDPHWDYRPPAEFARRFDSGYEGNRYGSLDFLLSWSDPRVAMPAAIRERIVGLYDGEIAYADHHLGRLVDALRRDRLLDSTIVVVFSDHGEEIKDHGSFGHGGSLYVETTRVPLVVRYPLRVRAGLRLRALASIADLPASLASLAGLGVPRQFTEQAVDLAPALRGGAPAATRTLTLETTRVGPKRFAIVEAGYRYQSPGSYRYIHHVQPLDAPPHEMDLEVRIPEALYALEVDPREQDNELARAEVSPASRHRARRLREQLWSFVEATLPGVRLICAGRGHGELDAASLVLTQPLLDEPVELGLGTGDRVAVAADLGPSAYRVNLAGGGRSKLVLFPLAPASGALLRVAGRVFEIPRPGAKVDLGGSAGRSCWCSNSARLASEGRGRYSLNAAETQSLRALGYLH